MTTYLGAFRDDFYNGVNILPQSQFVATAANLSATLLPASYLCGAGDCYLIESGQTSAQTATTDTAANIISYIQTAVAGDLKTSPGFAAGQIPPLGVTNLFNVWWTITINNQNLTAGTLTLTAGTGVTLAAAGTVSATVITFSTFAVYVGTITGPTTVTFTRVQ